MLFLVATLVYEGYSIACNSHRDVNKLNEVTDEAHDGKAHSDSLANLHELCEEMSFACAELATGLTFL